MKYAEIEKYFNGTEEDMVALLKDITPIFDMIDDYSQQILQNVMTTISEYEKAKTQLIGCIMTLNPILSSALTAKKNGMLHYYVDLKREIENKAPIADEKGKLIKEKFVDGSTKTESEEHVATYRRVRNIIQGYINSAWAGVNDCESRIIPFKAEYGKTK